MYTCAYAPEKFKGTMACDLFYKAMKINKSITPGDCYIVNLSSSNHSGSHFVAVFFVGNNKAEYFDPYGSVSYDKYLNMAFSCIDMRITHFEKPIQANKSQFCGFFCGKLPKIEQNENNFNTFVFFIFQLHIYFVGK